MRRETLRQHTIRHATRQYIWDTLQDTLWHEIQIKTSTWHKYEYNTKHKYIAQNPST